MKQKKITRKLSLNKTTLSNLETTRMNELKGGLKITYASPCAPAPTEPAIYCTHLTCDPILCDLTYGC